MLGRLALGYLSVLGTARGPKLGNKNHLNRNKPVFGSKTLKGLQIVLILGMLGGVTVQKEAQRHPFLWLSDYGYNPLLAHNRRNSQVVRSVPEKR